MNKLNLSGYAANDAEVRTTRQGIEVASFKLADNQKLADGSEEAMFLTVDVFGEDLSRVAKRVRKGDYVDVCGQLRPPSAKEVDGKVYVNLRVTVADSQMWSHIHVRPKLESTTGSQPL